MLAVNVPGHIVEVPITLNVVLLNNVGVITAEVAFVFHVYELAPFAVNVTELPEHITFEGIAPINTTGFGTTVTVTGTNALAPQDDVSRT